MSQGSHFPWRWGLPPSPGFSQILELQDLHNFGQEWLTLGKFRKEEKKEKELYCPTCT